MDSVLSNGRLFQNVNFVGSPEKAEMEVIFDERIYSRENDTWLYFRHGYLVATNKADFRR